MKQTSFTSHALIFALLSVLMLLCAGALGFACIDAPHDSVSALTAGFCGCVTFAVLFLYLSHCERSMHAQMMRERNSYKKF